MSAVNPLRRAPWLAATLAVILAVAAAVTVYGELLLRTIGSGLVVSDTVRPSDVVVITLDSGAAGVLEAADLVAAGIATRVVVFAEPLRRGAMELQRRGLTVADASMRQTEQLAQLGVHDVVRIASADASGTHAEAKLLTDWCREHRLRSVVLVTTADHSRRMRRVMSRSLGVMGVTVAIRPASFSDFDPGSWWKTTDGRRTVALETQKLLLDVVTAPLN